MRTILSSTYHAVGTEPSHRSATRWDARFSAHPNDNINLKKGAFLMS
jgi:hypothetical protein